MTARRLFVDGVDISAAILCAAGCIIFAIFSKLEKYSAFDGETTTHQVICFLAYVFARVLILFFVILIINVCNVNTVPTNISARMCVCASLCGSFCLEISKSNARNWVSVWTAACHAVRLHTVHPLVSSKENHWKRKHGKKPPCILRRWLWFNRRKCSREWWDDVMSF